MKKVFEEPRIVVDTFSVEDVITTSSVTNTSEDHETVIALTQ